MTKTASSWRLIILTGLSMSIGWGIRGQFGHEYGAAIAGALGAMAVVLLSGREDWWRRIAYFATFGAIGWAFGGSMSYMKEIAYGHSPDSMTVLYGFGSIFFLGFLWAAPGGAGTALPAFLDRDKLTEMFIPMSAVFGSWLLEDILVNLFRPLGGIWLSTALPVLAVLLVVTVRRRFDIGSELVLHLCIGRCIGYVLLAQVLGLKLNPPRDEGWAGMVGLIAGLLLFCWRKRLMGVAFATVATGFLGGIGFALGELLKLINISTGLHTNWHSVMEQTQGLFHGVALAVVMGVIIRRAPKITDRPEVRRWTDAFAVAFVLWGITYLNFRRSPADWVQYVHTMPDRMYGIWVEAGFLPSRGFIGWFDIAYLVLGVALVWLLCLQVKRGLPLLPKSWLGRGQLLYLSFLWAITFINFAHVIVRFTPIRLVTEFAITINAAVCTVLMVTGALAQPVRVPDAEDKANYGLWIRKVSIAGVLGAIVISVAGWSVKRALFDDTAVPGAGVHIRFGPNNTNNQK